MKNYLATLFAFAAFTFTVSAAPSLLVDLTVTELHIKGGTNISHSSSGVITVESGKKAIIPIGKSQFYYMTPTLLQGGIVDVRAVLKERKGKKETELVSPRIKARLGEVAEVTIGDYTFKTKTLLAK